MTGDDLAHVGAGGVGQLEVAPVEDFPQWAVFGEALVNDIYIYIYLSYTQKVGLNAIRLGRDMKKILIFHAILEYA